MGEWVNEMTQREGCEPKRLANVAHEAISDYSRAREMA